MEKETRRREVKEARKGGEREERRDTREVKRELEGEAEDGRLTGKTGGREEGGRRRWRTKRDAGGMQEEKEEAFWLAAAK